MSCMKVPQAMLVSQPILTGDRPGERVLIKPLDACMQESAIALVRPLHTPPYHVLTRHSKLHFGIGD